MLLSHKDIGADIRLTLNRASETDTASLLYQSAFSGRAEMGLAGDNRFQIKTSPDGQNWQTALSIDPNNARVSLPHTQGTVPMINLLGDGGRFAGSPEPFAIIGSAFQPPAYLSPLNGAQFVAGPTYSYDSVTYGGSGPALDPEFDALLTPIYGGPTSPHQRFGMEFNTLEVTAGTGLSSPKTVAGVEHYQLIANRQAALPQQFTWTVWIRVLSGSVVTAPAQDGTSSVKGAVISTPTALSAADGWIDSQFVYDIPRHRILGYVDGCLAVFTTPGTRLLIAMPSLIAGKLSLNDPAPFRVASGTGWMCFRRIQGHSAHSSYSLRGERLA